MTTFFKDRDARITADMTWYSSDCLTTKEMRELDSLDVDDLIAYAEAVPSWDFLDPAMWDFIAYWCDLDCDAFGEGCDFDPEAFLEAAKAARS